MLVNKINLSSNLIFVFYFSFLHQKINSESFKMAKADTEKEILALRYPIDIDVTDDVFKKRYVSYLNLFQKIALSFHILG